VFILIESAKAFLIVCGSITLPSTENTELAALLMWKLMLSCTRIPSTMVDAEDDYHHLSIPSAINTGSSIPRAHMIVCAKWF